MTSNFELCFQIILIGMTLIFLIQMSCENISMLLWRMYGILHQELWTSSLILLSFAWFGLRLSPNQEIKNGPIVYKILLISCSKIVLFNLSFFIFFKVEIVIKNPSLHTIEAHEIDQSTHNYYINQMKTDYIVPKTVAITKFGKQTLTTKLKKSNDCNQEKLKVSKCLKENTSVCIWIQT